MHWIVFNLFPIIMWNCISILPLSGLSAMTANFAGVSLASQASQTFQDDNQGIGEAPDCVVWGTSPQYGTNNDGERVVKASSGPSTTKFAMSWPDIRPIFENLYIVERFTLTKTMNEIRYRYGFAARYASFSHFDSAKTDRL